MYQEKYLTNADSLVSWNNPMITTLLHIFIRMMMLRLKVSVIKIPETEFKLVLPGSIVQVLSSIQCCLSVKKIWGERLCIMAIHWKKILKYSLLNETWIIYPALAPLERPKLMFEKNTEESIEDDFRVLYKGLCLRRTFPNPAGYACS